MNALRLFSVVSLAVVATAVSLTAAGTNTAATPSSTPRLQVVVNVPPNRDLFFESDVSRAMGAQLGTVFRRQGYEGEVILRDGPTSVKADQSLLTLILSEWRLDHGGTVACRFNATLTVAGKEQNLGQYNGTALTSMTGNRGPSQDLWLESALEDAAKSALTKLYRDVAGTSLVPGFKVKQK